MPEFWSYTIADILLFSPRVYFRLFELRNEALWPAQILTIAIACLLGCLAAWPTPARRRGMLQLLGAVWLWIAWSFFWTDYATINWAAAYMAPLAALQGALLIGAGLLRARPQVAPLQSVSSSVLLGLFAFSLAAYPLIAPAADRSWFAAEMFGIAPDPTAVATLALIGLTRGALRWLMMLLPALWCAVTGLTLWALEANDFFIAPACALIAIAAASASRSGGAESASQEPSGPRSSIERPRS